MGGHILLAAAAAGIIYLQHWRIYYWQQHGLIAAAAWGTCLSEAYGGHREAGRRHQ